MKNTKINMLLLAALVAVQTTVHAKDKEDKPAGKKRTYVQAAYDNRYNIALGSAAIGLGALGFVYGEDFMAWYNAQPVEVQAQAQVKIEESIEKDLQIAEEKQEMVAEKLDAKKHNAKDQKETAQELKEIAKIEEQVAQKQSWLQSIGDFLGSKNSARNNSSIQEQIDADNAAYLAENPDYRSSDDFPRDSKRGNGPGAVSNS